MSFKFEKLVIWQKAMHLGEVVNALAANFTEKEKFNISTQICRAVDSVALNISEGSIEQSKLEYKKFMGYAIRSLAEVVTCLHKAQRRNNVTEKVFIKNYDYCFQLMNMMIAFKEKIK
jgi:four helix bundle protein